MHPRSRSAAGDREPRPPSPPRDALPPMTQARPGPNAFAQQAARMERHRLESNAFYQAEVQRRKITPPTTTHPALRDRGNGADRDSSITTMSSFINAGKTPPLNLVPIDELLAEPTTRGYIEERREQLRHQASGSSDERVPVYQTFAPTPKLGGGEAFENGREMQRDVLKTPGKGKGRVSLGGKDGEKSPTKKGGFFEKLKLGRLAGGGGGGSSASPSMSTLVGAEEFLMEEAGMMPVKAQAVLGASPSKPNVLARSPSKQGKRSLFAAKKTALNVDTTKSQSAPFSESGQKTGSSVGKTPQTAFSDPTHYSYVPIGTKHVASQTLSDRDGVAYYGTPKQQHAIQRSQSLKYFDSGVPPTPPAKNTPPELKDKDQTANNTAGVAATSKQEMQYTPSRSPLGLISLTGRISPTRMGGYAHKETARLVTRPSVYSLHASVVPEAMEASTFEEMKARVDGLDLEGFSMPSEMRSSPAVGAVYSPSVYGEEWEGEHVWNGVKGKGRAKRMSADGLGLGLGLPTVKEEEKVVSGKHKRTKGSDESAGTIQMCYPELAKDPSLSPDMKAQLQEGSPADKSSAGPHMSDTQQHDEQTSMHGRTHSKDHNNDSARLSYTHLFAAPFDEVLQHSPASYSHKSAMPSPLQYLPATTYSPPPKSGTKHVDQGSPSARSKIPAVQRGNSGSGIENVNAQSGTTKGTVAKGIYDNMPDLSVKRCDSPSRSLSSKKHPGLSTSTDPAKRNPSSAASSGEHDKMDQVLALLSALRSRDEDVQAMREEMRAANARLDARLAQIERVGTGSLSPNSSMVGGLDVSSSDDHMTDMNGEVTATKEEGKRVSTCDAHDFYRLGSTGEGVDGENGEQHDVKKAEGGVAQDGGVARIAELVMENRQLTEMVQGFATQLEEMRRSMRGR